MHFFPPQNRQQPPGQPGSQKTEQDIARNCHQKAIIEERAKGCLLYTSPVVVSLTYFNYALSACIGAFFAIGGLVDLGTLASYLVYVRQAAMPVNQFSQQMNSIMAGLALSLIHI